MPLAPPARTQPAGANTLWPCACGRCYMPRRCCGVRPAARVMPWPQKMTIGGWPLAGKAHSGDDHPSRIRASRLACHQPGMSSGHRRPRWTRFSNSAYGRLPPGKALTHAPTLTRRCIPGSPVPGSPSHSLPAESERLRAALGRYATAYRLPGS